MRVKFFLLFSYGMVLIFSLLLLFSLLFILPANHNVLERTITVEKGMHFDDIKSLLVSEKIISSAAIMDIFTRLMGSSRELKAGNYTFTGRESYREILHILEKGQARVVPVTIPEGFSLLQISSLLEDSGIADKNRLLESFTDVSMIKDLDSNAQNLEGYLFPDTYFFSENSSANTARDIMLHRFLEIFKPEWKDRAKELGLTVKDVVTLASLIEKETACSEERELISSVFHNRLKRGMLLQCDPTVIYALMLEGRYDGNIRKDDLKFDSPYNTYVYAGLPPGPIANPGEASMKAALYPARTTYLYFVSKNDGTHHFSSSLREHNNAVIKYQKRYWRKKWRQK